MHPTLVRESFHRDGWVYERGTTADAWSPTSTASTYVSSAATVAIMPPVSATSLAQVAELPARTLILDGELCAFDVNLVSLIYLLDASPEERATPPVFMAFDCLYQRGRTR